MNAGRRKLILLPLATLLCAVVAFECWWNSLDPVRRHRLGIRWTYLPPPESGFRRFLNPQYYPWTIEGRPSGPEARRRINYHFDELEKCGYLTRRAVELQHVHTDKLSAFLLMGSLKKAAAQHRLIDPMARLQPVNNSTITVIARTNEIDAVVAIVREHDRPVWGN